MQELHAILLVQACTGLNSLSNHACSPAHLQGKRCCIVPVVAVDYMALNGQHSLAAGVLSTNTHH